MENRTREDIKVLILNKKRQLSALEIREQELAGSSFTNQFELSIVRAEIYLVKDFISDLEFILTL